MTRVCQRSRALKKGCKKCKAVACLALTKPHCLTCHASLLAGAGGCVWLGERPDWALSDADDDDDDEALPPAAAHLIETREEPIAPSPPPAPPPALAFVPLPRPERFHLLPMSVGKEGVIFTAESIGAVPTVNLQWKNPKPDSAGFEPFLQKARLQQARAAQHAIEDFGEPDWKRKAEKLSEYLTDNHKAAKKLREENDSLARRLTEAEATTTNALKDAEACQARAEGFQALETEAKNINASLREEIDRFEEVTADRVAKFIPMVASLERDIELQKSYVEEGKRLWDKREREFEEDMVLMQHRAFAAEAALAASEMSLTADIVDPSHFDDLTKILTGVEVLEALVRNAINASPPSPPALPSEGLLFDALVNNPAPQWVPLSPLP